MSIKIETMRKFSGYHNTVLKSPPRTHVSNLTCYYSLHMSPIASITKLGLAQLSRFCL